MARVTVEDCIEKVENRFELVMMASQRARKIGSGAPLLVDRDNDKNPVISLREIADEKIAPEDLKEELIKTHQRIIEMDDTEEVIDMMDGEAEWNTMANQAAENEMDLDEIEEDGDSIKRLEGEPSPLDDIAGIPQE